MLSFFQSRRSMTEGDFTMLSLNTPATVFASCLSLNSFTNSSQVTNTLTSALPHNKHNWTNSGEYLKEKNHELGLDAWNLITIIHHHHHHCQCLMFKKDSRNILLDFIYNDLVPILDKFEEAYFLPKAMSYILTWNRLAITDNLTIEVWI